MLSDDEIWTLWNSQGVDDMNQKEASSFARNIEAAVLEKLQAQSEPIGYAIPTFNFDNAVIQAVQYAGTVPVYAAPVQQEPVMWQFRFFDSHPQTVTSGTWSKWEEVTPRNTVEDIRAYIKQGYKYELRALYAAPVQVLINGMTKAETDASASVKGLTVQQERVACKKLCELCEKRGYDFCANAAKITPLAAVEGK